MSEENTRYDKCYVQIFEQIKMDGWMEDMKLIEWTYR